MTEIGACDSCVDCGQDKMQDDNWICLYRANSDGHLFCLCDRCADARGIDRLHMKRAVFTREIGACYVGPARSVIQQCSVCGRTDGFPYVDCESGKTVCWDCNSKVVIPHMMGSMNEAIAALDAKLEKIIELMLDAQVDRILDYVKKGEKDDDPS